MGERYCYSFVEDEPSQHVVRKILKHINASTKNHLIFPQGFPSIKHGNGELKKVALRCIPSVSSNLCFLIVTDLDTGNTPQDLGKDWFDIPCLSALPPSFIFRVAVREVESWLIADRVNFASFLNISEKNFPLTPDQLPDPKEFLFTIIRRKCRKKIHKDMLPSSGQHIGIEYNPQLTDFIDNHWNIDHAAAHSPSLSRAVARITAYLND